MYEDFLLQLFRVNCPIFFTQHPLKIVRSYKQYMYEVDGTFYLDCINNVAHGEGLVVRMDVMVDTLEHEVKIDGQMDRQKD